MSNTCPKCGDIIDTDGIAYKCRSRIHPFEQSHLCEVAETAYNRGRAEAIAELDAKVVILTRALSKIADCTDDAEAADCATDALYKWREVRP